MVLPITEKLSSHLTLSITKLYITKEKVKRIDKNIILKEDRKSIKKKKYRNQKMKCKKDINMKITYQSEYKGMSINTNKQRKQGCIENILDNYQKTMSNMIDKHSKVMQIRFDLRYPDDKSVTPDSKHIQSFTRNFKRNLNREQHAGGNKVDAQVLWVKERDRSPHPHYHYLLLVNANAKQEYYPVVQEADRQWSNILKSQQDGLVDYCDKHGDNGIIVKRGSDNEKEQLDRCLYQASYLAKERSKDRMEKGARLYSSSHVNSKGRHLV
jgi:hypothetical protein